MQSNERVTTRTRRMLCHLMQMLIYLESIKKYLPEHAQSIWREAFNNALKEYNDEESAAKVAWSAVKKDYEKTDAGIWQLKGTDI